MDIAKDIPFSRVNECSGYHLTMHAHDQETLSQTLHAACDHVGLGDSFKHAFALADLCASSGEAVGHPALEDAAKQIKSMDLAQIGGPSVWAPPIST